jgi:hypothetical protein
VPVGRFDSHQCTRAADVQAAILHLTVTGLHHESSFLVAAATELNAVTHRGESPSWEMLALLAKWLHM